MQFSTLSLSAGSIVRVPAGETYLYDLTTSPDLGGVQVYGRLVFNDVANVAIQTKMITVYNGGEFIIGALAAFFAIQFVHNLEWRFLLFRLGSCDCPYSHVASITLTGDPSSNSPDGVGTKVPLLPAN